MKKIVKIMLNCMPVRLDLVVKLKMIKH